MANTKLIFCGTIESGTTNVEMVCYKNTNEQIYISLKDVDSNHDYDFQFICLDKSTAIKLHRELKKQISYIQEDVQNG